MNQVRMLAIGIFVVILTYLSFPAQANDFVVYSMFRPLNMGEPGEQNPKDYFINMGAKHGVKAGDKLIIFRKSPTYDLEAQKLFQDIQYPIGTLQVIHVDTGASVARMDSLLAWDKTPIYLPQGVMVGDVVRMAK